MSQSNEAAIKGVHFVCPLEAAELVVDVDGEAEALLLLAAF